MNAYVAKCKMQVVAFERTRAVLVPNMFNVRYIGADRDKDGDLLIPLPGYFYKNTTTGEAEMVSEVLKEYYE
jgi:hypothetical protein